MKNREERFANDILDIAKDFIKSNERVGDIFDQDEIVNYVKDICSPSEVFSFDELKDWANSETPDKIFDKSELEQWAEENGFVKP